MSEVQHTQLCTQHPHVEATRHCDGCHRPFCDQCVVSILERHYCADCKESTLAAMGRRTQQSPNATAALWMGIGSYLIGFITCGIGTPIFAGLGLALARRTIRELEAEPEVGNLPLAHAAAFVCAATLLIWAATMVAFALPLLGV